MNARCGLVNAANPCRCRKKTTAYVKRGLVDPKRLIFNADYTHRIDEVTRAGSQEAMETVDTLHESVFREHPFAQSRVAIVDEILGHPTIRTFFALE
jgi:hypothetical protein